VDPFVMASTLLGVVVPLTGQVVHHHYRARHAREQTLRRHLCGLPGGSTLIDLRTGVVLHVGAGPVDR